MNYKSGRAHEVLWVFVGLAMLVIGGFSYWVNTPPDGLFGPSGQTGIVERVAGSALMVVGLILVFVGIFRR